MRNYNKRNFLNIQLYETMAANSFPLFGVSKKVIIGDAKNNFTDGDKLVFVKDSKLFLIMTNQCKFYDDDYFFEPSHKKRIENILREEVLDLS